MTLDLQPIFYKFFNTEAQDIIVKHKTNSTLYQWNRLINDSKYSGSQAYDIGYLLEKLKIKFFEDLFTSNYVREVSPVYYFGWTVEESRIAEAALDVVNMFNDICNKKLMRAVLTPLVSLKLYDGRYIVVSYFAIDLANFPLVQSMYGHCQFLEGAMPPEFK